MQRVGLRYFSMARLQGVVLFALATSLAVALAGCAEPTGTDEQTCTAEDGATLEEGDQTIAPDGCNTCTCRSGELRCTTTICEPPPPPSDGGPTPEPSPVVDAGPPIDAGLPADRPANCVDLDEDGFFTCVDEDDPALCDCVDVNNPLVKPETDCDDTRWFVQPGGYEYPDNGIDDNCNQLTDTEEREPCGCEIDNTTTPDLVGAMDLCDDTLVSSAFVGDEAQVGVYPSYFGDITPQTGDCYTVLSTGTAGATTVNGDGSSFCECSFGGGCVDDPDPINPSFEGVCDLGQIQLVLDPPPNARGFEFEFMFLSAEWPEFLCQDFNDTFYTLVETSAVAGGERSNISFDPQEREITVNVGFFEPPRQWSVPLDQTPFGAPEDNTFGCGGSIDDTCELPGYCPSFDSCTPPCADGESCVDLEETGNYSCIEDEAVDLNRAGSGSGWLVTRSPVDENEDRVTVTFSVHDEGDGIYDSLVVIDSFRWVPYSPQVGTSPKD